MHEQHAQNLADVGSPKLAPKRRRRAARLPHLGQVENARAGYRAGADGGDASRLRHRQLLLPPRSTSPSTSAVRGVCSSICSTTTSAPAASIARRDFEATLPQVARKADGLDGALVIMFDERHAIPRYAATVPRVM